MQLIANKADYEISVWLEPPAISVASYFNEKSPLEVVLVPARPGGPDHAYYMPDLRHKLGQRPLPHWPGRTDRRFCAIAPYKPDQADKAGSYLCNSTVQNQRLPATFL